MSAKCINKIPKGLPDLPPVLSGWDAWEYMGLEWKSKEPCIYGYSFEGADWYVYHYASNSCGGADHHYIRAVKLPAKKPKAKAVSRLRREPLKMQFATAIQIGRPNEAMSALDIAEDCMRLLDNHQRAKRRRGGK